MTHIILMVRIPFIDKIALSGASVFITALVFFINEKQIKNLTITFSTKR